MAGIVRTRGIRPVMGLLVSIALAVSVVGAGATASAGGPKFSTNVGDYLPKKIDGQKVVIDPRSDTAPPTGGCQIPNANGVVFTPLVQTDSDVIESGFGGIWKCPVGQNPGSGFVVGLDASKVAPTVPALSEDALLDDPLTPPDPGSLKALRVKVAKGVKVEVFTWTDDTDLSPCEGDCPPPKLTVVAIASAEPVEHLLVTASTTGGQNPVRYLKAQLKAGLSKTS